MLTKIQSLNADFDESEELTKFIGYLNGYNKGNRDGKKKLLDFEKSLWEFFEHRWRNDHNQFVSSEGEYMMLD